MDPSIPTHDINELISVPKKKVKKGEKKVKGEKKKKPKQEFVDEKVEISQGFDKPEGYVEPVKEKSKNYKDQLASIDLTIPSEVVLPTAKEYKKVTSEEILAQEKQKKELKKEAKETTTKKKKKREADIEAPVVKDLLSFEEPKKETKKKEIKKESLAVAPPTKQKKKKLCHDDNIKVSYSKAVPVNANQIDIPLHIENVSSFDISSIEYNIQAPMNMKVIGGEGNIATNLKLPKSLSGDIQLSIGFKSIKKAASLNGVLTYKTNVRRN
jgi:hypothetical protein